MEKEVVLKIKNLRKSYLNKEVLKGIDLEIHKGEIIGYIGPNGAGKSTTVKIILGLIDNYEGNIEIFGENIKENSIEYKRKIGYVPEIAEVYDSLTAAEYMSFLGDIYDIEFDVLEEKALKLMKLFGIENAYSSRISSYSKGMKQKFLIICSMIHNPEIYFLDEPIGGLDANSVMIFKEILAKLAAKGKTIFYSSHIMEVVEKISNRIILLNDGFVAADGTFEELKKNNKEGSSLESIFNDITGFNNHASIAEEFVSIL